MPGRGIVVNHDRWVVDHPPTTLADRPGCLEVVAYLGALAPQSRVERSPGAGPEGHVGPFEVVDVLQAGVQVVVSDPSTPPQDAPHACGLTFQDVISLMDDVGAAHGADSGIGGKPICDRLQPISPRYRVIIGDRYELAARRLAPAVQRRDLARTVDEHHPHASGSALGDPTACNVISAKNHNDLERGDRLLR